MTKDFAAMPQEQAIQELFAAHIAIRTIYETVLANLLKTSPVASTLREAFPSLLEEIRHSCGKDSLAYKQAESAIKSICRE